RAGDDPGPSPLPSRPLGPGSRPDFLHRVSGPLLPHVAARLAQVDVVVDPCHPLQGDVAVFAARPLAVPGQLDRGLLDAVHDPDLLAARADDLHVLADAGFIDHRSLPPVRATGPGDWLQIACQPALWSAAEQSPAALHTSSESSGFRLAAA